MEDIRALTGIVIDPGHGGIDSGPTYKNILETGGIHDDESDVWRWLRCRYGSRW